MKKYKHFIIGVVFALIISLSFPSFATIVSQKINVILNEVSVKLNGTKLKTDTITYNGKYYAPIEDMAKACDKSFNINSKDKIINIEDKNKPVTILSRKFVDGVYEIKFSDGFVIRVENYVSFNTNDFGCLISFSNSSPSKLTINNYCFKGVLDDNKELYPENKADIYGSLALKNSYSIDSKSEVLGYIVFIESIKTLKFIDGVHNCNLKLPYNAEISNTTQEKSKSTDLSIKEGIIQYLTDNYSFLETSMGKTNFTFDIIENDRTYDPYDYWIMTDFDFKFFSDVKSSIKYTNKQKNETKQQLKDFQEKLAKDLISKFPNKKFYGGYHTSWYRYPNLRVDLQARRYYSWTNYIEPNILSSISVYEQTKPSTFRWWNFIDDEL